MANTYLTRTPSSASNRRTFTISTWVKLGSLGGNTTSIFSAWYADSTVGHFVFRGSSDKFGWSQWSNDSYSTRLFRDVNGWYHVVLAVDTTQATASNRIKLYVNGVQETSFSVGAVYPSQNEELPVNNNNRQTVGSNYYSSNANFFDGSMSHFHLIDGTAYDASYFGETDATTGEWKIKTSPSVTYGTNGFFILKDGNSVTDQSGNSNNFTVGGGTLTKTEDSPSNVFATGNALSKHSNVVLSSGNLNIRNDVSGDACCLGTIGSGSGKYYWENYTYGGGNTGVGIVLASVDGSSSSAFVSARVMYNRNGEVYKEGAGGGSTTTGYTYGDTDIIGIALDTENGNIKFYKNGTLVNTTTDSALLASNNTWIPLWSVNNGGEYRANFGNGYFGTTAVSSAGTNASGIGIFEYDVPTGYTALSTKGLNL